MGEAASRGGEGRPAGNEAEAALGRVVGAIGGPAGLPKRREGGGRRRALEIRLRQFLTHQPTNRLGPRGAGKTTLALHLAAAAEAEVRFRLYRRLCVLTKYA